MKLVRPQKISDQVLSVLEARIVEGVYAEGGKIPPERVLAEEFGVSRPSVRSALNVWSPVRFGSEAGRRLLCFGQAAAGFFAKLAGAFGQAFQLGTGCF